MFCRNGLLGVVCPDPSSAVRAKRQERRFREHECSPYKLAPDIIEAILRGDEPDGLSLEKLRKNLPVRWDEQRRAVVVNV